MGASVRIIAKLDIKGPNLIKGFQFDGHRVLGRAEQFAEAYYREGADELIYQDAVASVYQRNSLVEMVERTAKRSFLPLTVAGGIRSLADIKALLRAGADKVAINTAAVKNPELIREAAQAFGSQCIVGALEVFRQQNGALEVWVDYGRERTCLDAVAWAKQLVELGVGELLVTSISRDGTGKGYDLDLISKVVEAVSVPVIASGGAGQVSDVVRAVTIAKADAVAVASMLHYQYAIRPEVRDLSLRMGKSLDTGSMDFLCDGYGGLRDIPVTPTTVGDIRSALQQNHIKVREHQC